MYSVDASWQCQEEIREIVFSDASRDSLQSQVLLLLLRLTEIGCCEPPDIGCAQLSYRFLIECSPRCFHELCRRTARVERAHSDPKPYFSTSLRRRRSSYFADRYTDDQILRVTFKVSSTTSHHFAVGKIFFHYF